MVDPSDETEAKQVQGHYQAAKHAELETAPLKLYCLRIDTQNDTRY